MPNSCDGGAAFPIPRNHNSGDAIYASGDGLSLRDYFAAKAMHEYLVVELSYIDRQVDEDHVAECAYSMADAMLRARYAQSPAETHEHNYSRLDAARMMHVCACGAEQSANPGELAAQSPREVQDAHLATFGATEDGQ